MGTSYPTCRDSSLSACEAVGGTAVEETRYWILLECHGYWPPRIPGEAHLGSEVKAHLARFLEEEPLARLQYIKPPKAAIGETGLRLFLITLPSKGDNRIQRTEIRDYRALLGMDFHRLFAGLDTSDYTEHHEPLVLICTHGKRDACCATHGLAWLKAIPPEKQTFVWQTSHLGGHRFAPTAMVFPSGHCYGRLDPAQAEAFIDDAQNGRMHDLACLRGFVGVTRPGQIAEFQWRSDSGNLNPLAIDSIDTEVLASNTWQVTLHTPERQVYNIDATTMDQQVIPSCGKTLDDMKRFTAQRAATPPSEF
jgi:hypothetical protein